MLRTTFSTLDSEIININGALRKLFAWTNKSMAFFLVGGCFDETLISEESHHMCGFSSWLKSKINFSFIDMSHYNAIDAAHKQLHLSMKDLHFSIFHKNKIESSLNSFFEKQQDLLQKIDSLRFELIAARNNYDTLTGLPLRYVLYKDYSIILEKIKECKVSYYISILDVDKFKTINDSFGHNSGDLILRELGGVLMNNMSDEDIIYRFGGEEFIILHKCDSVHNYLKSIDYILNEIRSHNFTIPQGTVKITVTSGGGLIREDMDIQSAIDQADQAMYYGKGNGRNQAVVFCEEAMLVQR